MNSLNNRVTVSMITMNEELAVRKVVTDIKKSIPGAEILIVDSSSDRTAEIAQSLGARVVRQYPPKGYGPAMDLALKSASGEVVVTLDCDDTYPAEEISRLASLVLENGYDIVDASRLSKKPEAMPWINYLANWSFALFASILFGKRITDLHSGMRAYRKTMLEKIEYKSQGEALPVELLLRPLKLGFKFRAVFIDYKIRIGVSTMQPLASAIWTFRRIMTVRFS